MKCSRTSTDFSTIQKPRNVDSSSTAEQEGMRITLEAWKNANCTVPLKVFVSKRQISERVLVPTYGVGITTYLREFAHTLPIPAKAGTGTILLRNKLVKIFVSDVEKTAIVDLACPFNRDISTIHQAVPARISSMEDVAEIKTDSKPSRNATSVVNNAFSVCFKKKSKTAFAASKNFMAQTVVCKVISN